ncbi:hypothetical protein B0H19DRAFT_1386738 [Mycena capillaripes]|nr:hypothetical protein B0H19DRAFT_1386738 [Mycena capillaripes]
MACTLERPIPPFTRARPRSAAPPAPLSSSLTTAPTTPRDERRAHQVQRALLKPASALQSIAQHPIPTARLASSRRRARSSHIIPLVFAYRTRSPLDQRHRISHSAELSAPTRTPYPAHHSTPSHDLPIIRMNCTYRGRTISKHCPHLPHPLPPLSSLHLQPTAGHARYPHRQSPQHHLASALPSVLSRCAVRAFDGGGIGCSRSGLQVYALVTTFSTAGTQRWRRFIRVILSLQLVHIVSRPSGFYYLVLFITA